MKTETLTISEEFAKKIKSEKEKLERALELAEKKQKLSLIQFSRMCEVVAPTVLMPERKKKKKRKRLSIEKDFNKLYKLI